MIHVRKDEDRGYADHGWLKAKYSFSFANYHDPRWMGFRLLRVINEDHVAAGRGFGSHPHRDMEILTYVLDGALEHRDSMGNGAVINPGDLQQMSAGTGIVHSEFNASETEEVHHLQIWLLPERRNLEPKYEQRTFPEEDRRNTLRIAASPDGADGSVRVQTDARLYLSLLDAGASVEFARPEGRHLWLQVARGAVTVNGTELEAGDGAFTSDEDMLTIEGRADADFLLFDLP